MHPRDFFSSSKRPDKFSLGTEIKSLVLSDGEKNYRVLNICLLVILFLDYVINKQDTNKIFIMQSGLMNKKCTCFGIILTPCPNINQRLNIFTFFIESEVLPNNHLLVTVHFFT